MYACPYTPIVNGDGFYEHFTIIFIYVFVIYIIVQVIVRIM